MYIWHYLKYTFNYIVETHGTTFICPCLLYRCNLNLNQPWRVFDRCSGTPPGNCFLSSLPAKPAVSYTSSLRHKYADGKMLCSLKYILDMLMWLMLLLMQRNFLRKHYLWKCSLEHFYKPEEQEVVWLYSKGHAKNTHHATTSPPCYPNSVLKWH